MNSDEMSEELQNVEFEVFGLEGAVDEVEMKYDEVNKRFDKHLADYVRLKKHVGKTTMNMISDSNLSDLRYGQMMHGYDAHEDELFKIRKSLEQVVNIVQVMSAKIRRHDNDKTAWLQQVSEELESIRVCLKELDGPDEDNIKVDDASLMVGPQNTLHERVGRLEKDYDRIIKRLLVLELKQHRLEGLEKLDGGSDERR